MIVKADPNASPLDPRWIPRICQVAISAGEATLEVYDEEFAVETKEDDSPLTEADRRSHSIIAERLAVDPELSSFPVLSEEGPVSSSRNRAEWRTFWLVDPLDGTKEFVKRNDEFTVNIALVHRGRPVFGAVFAPALDTMYYGAEGQGAYRLDGVLQGAPPFGPPDILERVRPHEEDDDPGLGLRLSLRPVVNLSAENRDELVGRSDSISACAERQPSERSLRVVASRSHLNEETKTFVEVLRERYKTVELVSRGSSLKLCLVAEGSADIYPRFGPTMEWDTAAGDAIARAAGALVTTVDWITPLAYNKESLQNPSFIVRAPWVSMPEAGGSR